MRIFRNRNLAVCGHAALSACGLLAFGLDEVQAQIISGRAPVGTRGHELYYEVQGSGEPVVLIHGLTLDLREWDAQVEALAEKYQVIRYDVVGHGKSSGLSSTLPNASIRDWEYLRELLDELDVDKAHIVGLSMGGGIAINFALQYPNRVQTLTPMDARLGGYDVPSELGDRFNSYINVSSSQGVQAALPLWAADPLFAPANANPDVRMKLEEIVIQGHGALGAGAMFQWPNIVKLAGLSPSAMSRLHEIDIPTLVMIGELDLIDFQLQANIIDRDIPNSTKLVVPSAGHMSDMEQPEFVNAALLDFFADHPITMPILGDFNGDSVVDAADLAQWSDDFGLNGDSDADGDGDSDGADFLAWQRQLGTNALAQSLSRVVPEPPVTPLLSAGLLSWGLRARSRGGKSQMRRHRPRHSC